MTFSSIYYDEIKTMNAGNFYVRKDGKIKHKSVPMMFQVLWREPTKYEAYLISRGVTVGAGRVATIDKPISQQMKRRVERFKNSGVKSEG